MLERWLLLKDIPRKQDLALLLIRIFAFAFLIVKHGWVDLSTFGALSQNFRDPIHIGPMPTLVLATISDALCAVLILFGLATRWAALYTVLIHFVAVALVFHFNLVGTHANADVVLQYTGFGLALYFLGAGKYSLDAMIQGAKQPQPAI
jgi:putative oxidoreductase